MWWHTVTHGRGSEEETGVSSITTADAHTSAASRRLNWRPHRFKWTRSFRRKTKSGFCACAITFQTQSIKACHTATASHHTSPFDPERWTTVVNVAHLMGNRPGEPNLYNGLHSFATSKFPTLQTPTQTDLHPEHFLFQKVTPVGAEVW
jgi:hypothetical protein